MPYLLALDQGTTSSRTVLYDSDGRVIASAQKEFPQYYPQPGWVEHDAEEIWASQEATLREVLGRCGVPLSEIAGVGISNQRETTIVWERDTGRPLSRAIVWQDRRTAERTEAMKGAGEERGIREKTGLLLDPYFSATKLAWLLESVDGLRERGARGEVCFGTVDSWLIYRLSGGRVHVTDVSNASRTLLFNIHTLQWDPELLARFGIPAAMLPEVLPCAASFARCALPGLEGLVVTGVAGDQQAALFGQGCFAAGMAKATYGTGAFIVMNSGKEPVLGEGVLTTIGWQLGNEVCYALEGSVFIAGAALQWLRDGLGILASSAEAEALARSVPDNGGVYFVPALTGLGTPYWDPFARGVIAGLTRGSGRGHLVRAALEAIAYQTCDAIEAMERAGNIPVQALRVDGGAAANDLLLQFQADLLGVPVLRPALTETTSLGAALLAGIGAGVFDLAELRSRSTPERRFEPTGDPSRRDQLRAGWRRAVSLALGWEKPS
ncbi:glycerol kinase GlpK [Geomesophilobacter sediminis]|uniref:Glycerol kinase n=1 Tax=Geomesophilobacter sediminis TaxID=2798584 RepID=A0A8J7S919_9BACT|nr:glycerol kinase GlpK [Geomesophilobacter sediminis]MBJ6727927.1 glycerol kinase GlpK [Geomesophilobacter sediminis]